LRAFIAVGISALMVPTAGLAGDTWPGWRGPTGLGLSDEKDLPLTWGGLANDNIVWKSALPGTETGAELDHNQSSPIVWHDKVFVMTAFWPAGTPRTEFPEHRVACYAARDGKLLWDTRVSPGPWLLKDLRGGYTAPTPCTDGKRVYALFGSSELVAIDLSGKLLWRREIVPFAWDVAIGTSPVLYADTVLILADGTRPAISRLIAIDRETGVLKWERKRPTANFNHTTPLLAEVAGKAQLLIASSEALQGVDPRDGTVQWWARNPGDVPTPIHGGGVVYSDSGRGGPGIAVDPTGAGDVSTTKVKWRTAPIPEGFSSPIIAGDYLFRVHRPGILKCFSLAGGKMLYSERLPNGTNVAASPILTADNQLYFASAGRSVVLRPGAKYEILATNDLKDDGPASPAIAHGRLFLKGSRFLYCIGKTGPNQATNLGGRP
jgi:outer membrane protein assembly factor BamB